MRTLIISSANLVQNGYNDTYQYTFPVPCHFKDDQIAVQSVAMYYSWFNITSSSTGSTYNNNTFNFTWPSGNAPLYNNQRGTYTITLPDGYYSVSNINSYVQSIMYSLNMYMTDVNGSIHYFWELLTNSTYYSIQFNAFIVPTSSSNAAALYPGYTMPTNFPYATTATTPQLGILSTNSFSSVIGFSAGTYPTSPSPSPYTVLSTSTPQVSPVSSLVMTCNLLNNRYAIPSTLLYSFTGGSTSYGSLIQASPTGQLPFVDVQNGSYNSFTIQFLDQNLRTIAIRDPNLVVLLVIRNKSET